MRKKSIRRQFAITTILLLAFTILICLLANILFLETIILHLQRNIVHIITIMIIELMKCLVIIIQEEGI